MLVDITVTVHVYRKQVLGAYRGGANNAFGEVLAAIVLIPRDLVTLL